MKKHSKIIALLLALVMTVASGSFAVSAAEGITVTAGDVALSDTESSIISLDQKAIDVAFADAVNDGTLADNVSVLADAQAEKVLHLSNQNTAVDYYSYFQTDLGSDVNGGVLNIKFSAKYNGSGKHPIVYVQNAAGKEVFSVGFHGEKFWLNSTLEGSLANTVDKWNDVEVSANFGTGTVSLKINGVACFTDRAFKNASDGFNKVRFNSKDGTGILDMYFKNIEVTHTANGSTTEYISKNLISNATVGSRPTGVTYGSAIGGATACAVETETLSTPVTVDRSLSADKKTYTLTNDLGWDTSKEYLLQLGDGIMLEGNTAALLDEAKNYKFVARNLTGVLTLDAVNDTNDNAVTDGGYMSAASEGINLVFSDAVDTNTISDISLTKNVSDRVMNTTLDAATGQYQSNWVQFAIPEGKTTGVYTFTTSVIVDSPDYNTVTTTGNKAVCAQIEFRDTSNAQISFIRPAVDRVEYSYHNGTKVASEASDTVKLPKAEWRDITYTLDLDNKEYTVTAVDPVSGTSETWNKRDAIVNTNAVGALWFGVYKYDNGGKGDVSWKNPKLTYTANGVTTTLFNFDTDKKTNSEISDVFDIVLRGSATGSCGLVERVAAPENIAWTPAYNPTTKTVAVIPEKAFEYLGKYTLTVPDNIMSADGAALYEGRTVNFTAIYSDSLYSADSGFKAGTADISAISSTFSGDIKGWADITNISGESQSATLIVALYNGGKLVDFDCVPVNSIGAGATVTSDGTVTIAAEDAGPGYTAAVYVWESMDTMLPISLKAITE